MPQEQSANPYVAVERGYVDAVIQPRDTRQAKDCRGWQSI